MVRDALLQASLLVPYKTLEKGNCSKNAHSWLKSDAKPLLDTIYVDKQGSVSNKSINTPPRAHWVLN